MQIPEMQIMTYTMHINDRSNSV